MRHDAHYVETLAASAGAPVGRMVPIDQVDPNPDQPRQAMGDLAELIASVTEKGIIEPLVVRQRGARYQIIAGERRYHAAVQAGLHELPVVIRDVDDREMLELALVENIQRKDLTPFEESEAMQGLAQKLRLHPRGPGQAPGQVADDDYRGVVAEPAFRPRSARSAAWRASRNRSLLLQIVRQGDPQKMLALVEKIASQGATREQLRKERREAEGRTARRRSCSRSGRQARRSTCA